jgi:hypothetical protein
VTTERQQLTVTVARLQTPLFPDTHPLDRALLVLRILAARREVPDGTAEAARTLGAYFELVLQEVGDKSHPAVPRIGDADWDELFGAKDLRLIVSAVHALKRIAGGHHSVRDVNAVERILNELQRRRRACDTYEEITSYDRALDLL